MKKTNRNFLFAKKGGAHLRLAVRALLLLLTAFVLFHGPARAQSGVAQSAAGKAGASAPGAAQSHAAKKPAANPALAKSAASPVTDLHKQPTLYVVAYAHLDTQWRWEYPQVIAEYLSKTMRNNFYLFEKYPYYIFNFTGANRYMMMKEYYPADFAKLKKYAVAGRWFPAGSSMEEGDVNSPNAESIFRQILYGNEFYRHEFGKASEEYMLPDCFGFPASLPSILAHAGIKGFSTQKLSSGWQPAPHVGGPDSPEKTPEGIPFNVGIWQGPDGSTVIAALNPLSYTSTVEYDLSKTPPELPPPPSSLTAQQQQQYRERMSEREDWVKRLQIDGELTGVFADYHYVGTGDTGGAPDETSVRLMEAIVTKGKASLPPVNFGRGPGARQAELPPPSPPVQMGGGPVHVMWSKADQMFRDILQCCKTDRMPRYQGDLELINHSAGSLTSETYQKRWVRKNELLADAAEKASIAADWLGGRPYPLERLNHAWRLVMGGQFHDILPGTATPKSFEFAWNDDIIAMNQFAGVLTSATEAVASALDTQGGGTSIVVYNPLNVAREDVVEATVAFPGAVPASVRISGPDGSEVPAQVIGQSSGAARILFLAKVPSVGFAVYDVQAAQAPSASSELKVSESSLENARYRIRLDRNGDVSSIFDKKLNRELLSAPVRLAISTDNPQRWPAWNMDFEDERRAPRTYVGGPARIRIVENGPVRVAVEVSREAEDSRFVQTVRLSAGDAGNRVEFGNVIDWKAKEANLKAVFPLSASNPMATYNWDVGTIHRPNEFDRQFEVPSHQWIDLTDTSGAFGVTVLTDCKNASDKPDDKTLRLTLMRTPGTRGGYPDQGSQDWGHHEFVFGLAGHEADWRAAQTDWHAYRLNAPLMAFESPKHAGSLGKEFSLLTVSDSRVRVLALKRAEESAEIILRAVEIDGKPASDVRFALPKALAGVREVNGQEMPVKMANALLVKGALVASFAPYQVRSFALKLGAPPVRVAPPKSQPVMLAYDTSVATTDGRPTEGCFDCLFDNPAGAQGKALPAEMLPREISFSGIHFTLAAAGGGKPNAVAARGQTIHLPPGNFNRIYLLAAAIHDQRGRFRIGDQPIELTIQNWTGFIGQWDSRTWNTRQEVMQRPADAPPLPVGMAPIRAVTEFSGLIAPGFIKRADVAWFASHRHNSDGSNEPYAYSYLFAYGMDAPAGTKTLTLPNNPRIRILAISLAEEPNVVTPAHLLYDMLERAPP